MKGMGFGLAVGIVAALALVLLFLYWWVNEPEPSQRPAEPRKRPKDDPKEYFWEKAIPELGDKVTVQVRNGGKEPSEEQLARIPGLAALVRKYDAVLRIAIVKAIVDYKPPKPKLRLACIRIDVRPDVLELHYRSEDGCGYYFSVFVTIADGKVTDVLFED